MANCTKCKAELRPGAKFCGKCGTKIEAAPTCPKCGAAIKAGAKFCGKCGTALQALSAQGAAGTVRQTTVQTTAPKAPPPPPAAALGYVLELPKGVIRITKEMVKLPPNFNGPIVIPEGIQVIDGYAFSGRAITGVKFPKSLKTIEFRAFKECQLKEVTIIGSPEKEKIVIRNNAFDGNSTLAVLKLAYCDMPNGVFIGCPVSKITIAGECELDSATLGFGKWGENNSCIFADDNFESTYTNMYGRANGSYSLKQKLVKTSYNFKAIYNCDHCSNYNDKTKRCFRSADGEYDWEMI